MQQDIKPTIKHIQILSHLQTITFRHFQVNYKGHVVQFTPYSFPPNITTVFLFQGNLLSFLLLQPFLTLTQPYLPEATVPPSSTQKKTLINKTTKKPQESHKKQSEILIVATRPPLPFLLAKPSNLNNPQHPPLHLPTIFLSPPGTDHVTRHSQT